MSAPTLFDMLPDPNYRAADPETSKAAGLTVDTNAREAEVLHALRHLVCASDTHDLQAVLEQYGMQRDRNCIARRLTSLDRKGLVRRAGSKVGAHGKPTTLWALTDQGRAVA